MKVEYFSQSGPSGRAQTALQWQQKEGLEPPSIEDAGADPLQSLKYSNITVTALIEQLIVQSKF